MPKQLNNGKVTESLQRAFGFKGRYIPMLDEVIVPVYVIADPAPAAKSKLCAATVTVSNPDGTGGFLVYAQLFNPVGSGNIVSVTNVVTSSDAKQTLAIRFFNGTVGVDRPDIHFRDRRVGGEPSTIIRRETNATSGQGDLVAFVDVDGALSQTAAWETQSGDPRQPLAVLDEGQGMIVQQNVDLLAQHRVNWRFLEIPITQQNPSGGLPG